MTQKTAPNHDYAQEEIGAGLHHLIDVGYIEIEREKVKFTPRFMLRYSVALQIEESHPRGRNMKQIAEDSFIRPIMDGGEVQNKYNLRELEIMLSLLPVINKHQHENN